MIEPVSSIAPSPSAALAERVASPPSGVEIASGPLPQATSAEASQFSTALQARSVESVTASHPLGGAKWSAVGKNVGRFLDVAVQRQSELRDRLRSEWLGSERGADATVGDHTSPALGNRSADVTSDPPSHFEFNKAFERLEDEQRDHMRTQIEMIDETMQFELLAKVTDGLGTSFRHLSNGGS